MQQELAPSQDDDPVVNGITKATLRKLWLTLSLVTLLFSWSVHGQLQGSDLEPGLSATVKFGFVPGVHDSIVALWGIIILSILVILCSRTLNDHASRRAATWRERYPFRIWDASPNTGIGRSGQVFAFVLFTLVPVFVLGHSWSTFLQEGKICEHVENTWKELPLGWWQLLTLPSGATPATVLFDGYRLAGEAAGCKDATTYFPVLEPVAMALLTVMALVCFLRSLSKLFGG